MADATVRADVIVQADVIVMVDQNLDLLAVTVIAVIAKVAVQEIAAATNQGEVSLDAIQSAGLSVSAFPNQVRPRRTFAPVAIQIETLAVSGGD